VTRLTTIDGHADGGDAPEPSPRASGAVPDERVSAAPLDAPAEGATRPSAARAPAGPARVATVPDRPASIPLARPPRGASRRAVVEFAGPVREPDLAALRREGFEVLSNAPGSNSVLVRLPDTVAHDPMQVIPRIRRVRVMMM
jgi:hypothetical protein